MQFSGRHISNEQEKDKLRKKPLFKKEDEHQPDKSSESKESSRRLSTLSKRGQKDEAVNNGFKKKFGKTKSEMIDHWLELDQQQIISECKKVGLKPSDKHIENIQQLLEFAKKFENDLISNPNAQIVPDHKLEEQAQQPEPKAPLLQKLFSKGSNTGNRKAPARTTSGSDGEEDHSRQNLRELPDRKDDLEQTKKQMSDQLSKIFQKRKKMLQEQGQDQHEETAATATRSSSGSASGGLMDLQFESHRRDGVHNRFQFNFEKLKVNLQRRGAVLMDTGVQQQFSLTAPDSQSVDKIFDLPMEQLPLNFQNYINEPDSVFNRMSLNQDEFDKLLGIQKKKLLINLLTMKETLQLNPNTGYLQQEMNIHKLVDFANGNWSLFNDASKQLVEQQITQFIGDNTQIDFKEPSSYVNLIKLAKQYSFEIQDNLRQTLQQQHLASLESMYFNATPEQAIEYAKILDFVIDDEKLQTYQKYKLQNSYYNGVKKCFNKKNLKVMTTNDMFQVLKILPTPEGDAYSSPKSLHHLILNELLTESNERFPQLCKEQVMEVVDKTMHLTKSRDLIQKLRLSLHWQNYQDYTLNDIKYIYNKLSEGKIGYIDQRIIQWHYKRYSKTFLYMYDLDSAQQKFQLLEYLHKTSPLSLNLQPMVRLMLFSASDITKKLELPLNDLVIFSKAILTSLFQPTVFFKEMLRSQQSFKTDISPDSTKELVLEINSRVRETEVEFEHLKLSSSRKHKNFSPFNELTFLLLQKIMNDMLQPGQILNFKELNVINQIFQVPVITKTLFRNADEMKKLIEPYVESIQAQCQEITEQHKTAKEDPALQKSKKHTPYLVNYDFWIEQFQALSNVYFLAQSTEVGDKIINLQENVFQTLELELNKTSELNYDKAIKLDKAVQQFFDHLPEDKIYQEYILKDVIKAVLESTILHKKAQILNFEKLKRNIKLSKQIQAVEPTVIKSNNKEIVHFLINNNFNNQKELVEQFFGSITNARTFVGQNLVNLFTLIDRYGLINQSGKILMEVAPNLLTIRQEKIYNKYPNQEPDEHFEKVNQKLEKKTIEIFKDVLKKYEHLYHHQPELLKAEDANLGPLSGIMAELFDQQTDDEILMFLNILGTDTVDNYHQDFITKLYQRYNAEDTIEIMADKNVKFFYQFAKAWPHFLKNNTILNTLINQKMAESLPQQQSETISILAKKRVLDGELMNLHFNTFIKMKDKERVAYYMEQFLHHCAYLGHGINEMEKLTQVMRRIYKSPEQVPNVSMLLDYFIVLALSDVYYKEFDEKSVQFLDSCLQYIEKKYNGYESANVEIVDPITHEKNQVTLNYYKSLTNANKHYNKVLFRQTTEAQQNLDFSKDFITETDENEEQILDSLKKSKKKGDSQLQGEGGNDDIDKLIEQLKQLQQIDVDRTHEGVDLEDGEKEQTDESQSIEASMFPESESKEPELIEDTALDTQENVDVRTGIKIKQNLRKSYERKASESQYSEELEFHQFRKKKMKDLDKKSRMLLMLSNVNQHNFVDINQNNYCKAWVVLFNFIYKSFDSFIHDEFQTVVMRNAIGKAKGHEYFLKFFNKLQDTCFKHELRASNSQFDEETGWPIDIVIRSNSRGQSITDKSKKFALFFFLQEEVSYNLGSEKEEPLGLQKLMLKHLQGISDHKVEFITENDFFVNKDHLAEYIEEVREKIMLS